MAPTNPPQATSPIPNTPRKIPNLQEKILGRNNQIQRTRKERRTNPLLLHSHFEEIIHGRNQTRGGTVEANEDQVEAYT